MIKTGKTKEEKSFLSKSPSCQFYMMKEKKREKRKTSNYVNERIPSFLLCLFTLVSDVFEKKIQRNRILGGMLKQRKMKVKLSVVISLIRYSYIHKTLTIKPHHAFQPG
jgi:hypothetical protein